MLIIKNKCKLQVALISSDNKMANIYIKSKNSVRVTEWFYKIDKIAKKTLF